MKITSIIQGKRKPRLSGRTILVLLLLVPVLLSGYLPATAAGEADGRVKVDLAITKQIIRGFGVASAWCGSISEPNMDILFKDMGLSILRVRIAPSEIWKAAPVLVDSGWTVELYNARKASARGAIVIATPWTPPASMKTNNSLVGGELKPEEYTNYAKYLKAFADYFAHNRVPLYAISIQNEPNIEVDYESCHWTGEQMRDFLKNHGEVFGGLRIIMPEAYNFDFRLSEPTLKDPEASKYVAIIGGHLYGAMIRDYPRARREGKEVWMTEHLVNDQSLRAALDTAKEIHDCLTIGNMNAYIWWWAISDANGFLSKQYVPQKRGYVVGQFAKFVRPGYYRVEATSRPAANVHVTAYKSDGKVVIVVINRRKSQVDLEFTMENGETAEFLSWMTTAEDNIAPGPAFTVTGGSFRTRLQAQSVTTFVGELSY